MKLNRIIVCNTRLFGALAAGVMAWIVLTAGPAASAQTTAANLSPDLQEIVKLAQARMPDDTILTFIKGSGKSYSLSADDMLYLSGQGVSQAVMNALLQTKGAAADASVSGIAPAPAPPPANMPAPAPAYAPAPLPAPPPGLVDNFAADAGLNPSVWMMQTPLVQSLAQWNGSVAAPPLLAFGPAGMQMSGVNGPGQLTGIQSVGAYSPPFTFTATVSGMAERGIPFEVYLVSPDLRQWLSVAGHLGGAGGPREGIGIRTPFGGARIPLGGGASPDYGVWANWTGSAQPISALGNKIYPAPIPRLPYTISMTVGADGIGSVSLQDSAGVLLGTLNAMPVGAGPFNVVLAARRDGPTFANWTAVQLTSLAPQPVAVVAPPATPSLDYFQAHLTPYGQWIDVPGIGPAWIPAEANNPDWRPYMDAGHWEYTDAGWYWQSDYPWGDIAFHYGRWIRNDFTAARWAWVPAYDWAPSWVAWREGEDGMGWAPLPWGVEFRAGLGLYWHGAVVVEGVDFGLGFDAFIFVGPDHFWGGDYRRFAFDRVRSREFFDHSQFHAGYRMEGGRLRAEGLGRDHMAAITHHEVVARKAEEMRHAEESHNFATRAAAHQELAHPPSPAKPNPPAGATTTSRPPTGASPAPSTTPRGGATPARGTPSTGSTTNRPASTIPGGAPTTTPRGGATPARGTPSTGSATNRNTPTR
ncbi:MAG: DUF6600 domain-containing protein [Verrucomicrobiota bacterium]|jgi:hypothetical protein